MRADDECYVCCDCGYACQKPFLVKDEPTGGIGCICFLIPILGIILYALWLKDFPSKSKSAGECAAWGIFVRLPLLVIVVFIVLVFRFR